jgi:hypothetical protein
MSSEGCSHCNYGKRLVILHDNKGMCLKCDYTNENFLAGVKSLIEERQGYARKRMLINKEGKEVGDV